MAAHYRVMSSYLLTTHDVTIFLNSTCVSVLIASRIRRCYHKYMLRYLLERYHPTGLCVHTKNVCGILPALSTDYPTCVLCQFIFYTYSIHFSSCNLIL